MPSPDTSPILSVRNLSTGYGKKQVLFDVSLDVMHGEIIFITGGNGSGKSTLLKAIYGLLPVWGMQAKILYRPDPDGPLISTSAPEANLGNGLAYLPQKNAVFEDLTVEDNLRIAGRVICGRRQFSARRNEVLELLPTLVTMLNRKPETMSGGERKMVALAMVLLHKPKILMLDEPTAGLTQKNIAVIYNALRKVSENIKLALVVVEHQQNEGSFLSRRFCRMRLGVLSDIVNTLEDAQAGFDVEVV